MEKSCKSSSSASPKLLRIGRKQPHQSNDAEHELRIKGLKSSIITVFGDALDKIGFSITEKANRSAQARLGKTLKSIEIMESKEEALYRKQKYELQMNLDKLHQQQINLKRECIKKASSLDDLDGIDRSAGKFVPFSSIGRYHYLSGHRNSAESVYTPIDYHNRNVLSVQSGSKHKLQSPKSAPRSFRSLGKENTGSYEQLDICKSSSEGPKQQIHDIDIGHHLTERRPATSNLSRNHESVLSARPLTCHSLRHYENYERDSVKLESETTIDATKKHSSEKTTFPKLNSKAHFLVQTPGTSRYKQISKTPETHRRNMNHQENHSRHTDYNKYNNLGTKKSSHLYDHSDWVPPTKEEMLQMLELEKEELQHINDFLSKKNPK